MHKTMKTVLALFAFVLCLHWSRRAAADVTITGTVVEIGVGISPNGNNLQNVIRFKFSDANQTKSCSTTINGTVIGAGYAYFFAYNGGNGDFLYREWYAALLVSKKGATLTCTVTSTTDCHVTSCTLT